ncbi:MAG TPA: hypothetical protein VFK05_07790 [Polyangiaceae bacterium]|nr:hypothetical protein [Polyangiaceae bacterium]
MTLSTSALADLREFACLGVSLMLVTRDERLLPEITRAAGARLGEDGLLRLALPLPESRRTVWNLETTPVVALSLVLPTTYRTLQVKGNDAHVVDWPGHELIARKHADNFVEEVVAVGIPREVADSFFSHHRYVCMAFTPLEIYDQTPGPASGLRVAP